MPPVIVWALGTIGAAVAAALFAKEAKRINAELNARRAPTDTVDPASLPKLERDPVTGEYRPR